MALVGFDLEMVRAATNAANGTGLFAHVLAATARGLSSRVLPIVIGVLIIALAAWRRTRRFYAAIFAMALGIGLTDPTCHYLIKPIFHRIRPCHADAAIRTLVHCGPAFSFPSNHASNGMAVAFAIVLATRPRWYVAVPLLVLGMLVGASRVVVGVHYPTDVLGGWCFGLLTGALAAFLARRLSLLVPERPNRATGAP